MGSPGKVKPLPDIILFDGMCNLCSGAVQFVIKRDKKNAFQFASLQSEFAKRQLKGINLDEDHFRSIVLLRGNQFFLQSSAALEIARKLNGGWPLMYGLKIIPRFIRDAIYDWIANNRYRFFGKKDACWIPSAELKGRFLE